MPSMPTGLDGNVQMLGAVSNQFTCALLTNGTITCWCATLAWHSAVPRCAMASVRL